MATAKRTPRSSPKKTKMASAGDMFTPPTDSSAAAGEAAPAWRLVTNHQNAVYMIAAGMVMGPSGFSGKHYADTLSATPGWAPLFRDDVPAATLAQVTSEAAHLKTCVLTLDQNAIVGNSRLVSKDGAVRDGDIPSDLRDDDIAVLVRTPLPASTFIGVSFKSKEDRDAFVSAAGSVNNVNLTGILFELNASLFNGSSELSWQPESATGDIVDVPPACGQSIGGILAMLYHAAHRSEIALAALRAGFRQPTTLDAEHLARDPVLRELTHWLDANTVSEHAEVPARLFWGVVHSIIQARLAGSPLKPIDETLRFLEGQLEVLEDQTYRPRLERLLQDMRRSLGFADSTVTELLERHRGSLSRPLMLFCLRENCDELLAFSHPLLSDAEFVLATVLFGAREGWLGLPQALKRSYALAAAVTHRMAEAEQQKNGSGLSFGSPPTRPIPVRELFGRGERGWNKAQNDAALALARERKWMGCVQTRIRLGKGEYRLIVESGGASLLLDGEVKAVDVQVDETSFMQKIATEPLNESAETAVRAALEK